MYCIVNGKLLNEDQAGLAVRDLALQRGYGVFDFFRLIGNRPLFLEQHLDRLWASAEGLHLQIPVERTVLTEQIMELIRKNNLPDSGVRITITGGSSADGYSPTTPNIIITQQQFALPSADVRQNGVVLATYNHQRQLPHIKTIDYLMAVWLQPWVKEQHADEVLYYNGELVTECPRSNVFVVLNDKTIITPSAHVLHGITRNTVVHLAATQFNVEERPVQLPELYMAKEVFITSTTKGILPVRKVDAATFATGPGTVTYGLQQKFAAYCAAHV